MKNSAIQSVHTAEDFRMRPIAGRKNAAEKNSLTEELERAKRMQQNDPSNQPVRLHSKVQLVEKKSGKNFEFTVVLPEEADIKTGKISTLSPLAASIIGCQKGDEVTCNLPGGTKEFLIQEVAN